MGNLVMRMSEALSIIRGDSIQSIAPEAVGDKVQYIEAFGKNLLMLPRRLYEPFKIIADREDLTVEQLVNGVLEAMIDRVENGLMEVTKCR